MIGDVMINCGGGPSSVCAARGRIASLCGPPSGSPSVTSSRDGACLLTAPRKPVLAVRYASAPDLSSVSAVASAPRGPCTGCAQRSALIRGRLLTAPSVSHYKGKHQLPQRVSPTTALEVSDRRHLACEAICLALSVRASHCEAASRRRQSVVVGERRRPVLDSRRERALDSSLGVRGGRDESVVTGVPRYSPVLAMRYASTLDFSRVSAVASAPRGPCMLAAHSAQRSCEAASRRRPR